MGLTAGALLGSYEVLSALGGGGMGEVYRAHDTKLARDVALKILPESFVHDHDRVARFRREAQVLASLNHPHIAAIYGLEEANQSQFLVLELVEGGTLADRLKAGPLPVDEALTIARQIADALEAAHDKGVIHRDLKPANIAFTSDGQVKVLDFGLAKALDPVVGSDVTNSPTLTIAATQAGVILGTAAYMSPEQAKGRATDKRSDVWAFGCVLYEMLTGKRAFAGEDATDVIAAVVRDEPDWSAVPNDVPEHIRLLLRRCLEKDHSKRVAAINIVRFLITEPATPLLQLAHAGTLVESRPPSLWKRVAPFVVTAVLVGAMTGVAVWVAKPTPASSAVTRFSLTLGEGQNFTSTGRQVVAISPNGSQIVYVANNQLYLRELASLEARPIAGTAPAIGSSGGVNAPVFSPDGRSLAFFSVSDSAIKRVAVAGGAAMTICPANNLFGMSWDESGIVFAQGPRGISRVSANGGKPEVLVSVKDNEMAHGPQILPGGNALLFTLAKGAAADRWDQAQIVVQSLKSGDRKILIDGGSDARYLPTGHLIYAHGGVLFAMAFDAARLETKGGPVPVVEGVRRSSGLGSGAAQFSTSNSGSLIYLPGPAASQSGMQDLAWVDRAGNVERLNLPARSYDHARMAPDGTHVAFGATDGQDANIYVYALGSGTSMQRRTFGGNNRFPIWTADGKRIAFQSDREGDRAIFWQPADGGAAERLTRPDAGTSHMPESWAPAGDRFLYTVTQGARVTLWVFSIQEKKAARFDDVESSTPTGSVFSPDGRWVAYASDGVIYVQPFPPTGAKYQVPRTGFDHHPMWSREGTELFYEPGPSQLIMVPVQTHPALAFGSPVSLSGAGLWGAANPALARNRDIAPDGKRFITPVVVDQTGSGTAREVRVVLNWFEELKARVPTK